MISLKNKDIYQYALNAQAFYDSNKDIYFPVKSSFYIYKNIEAVVEAAAYIDRCRKDILEKFGKSKDDKTYTINDREREFVQQELNDLAELYQDLNITKIHLSDLKDVSLTLNQIKAIAFMIEEDKEEEKEEEE
jgi:hypothetical protein